jgi:hypothetical protein
LFAAPTRFEFASPADHIKAGAARCSDAQRRSLTINRDWSTFVAYDNLLNQGPINKLPAFKWLAAGMLTLGLLSPAKAQEGCQRQVDQLTGRIYGCGVVPAR